MEENICVTVQLTDRPDNEQPDPFFIEGSLKWQDLEAMVKFLFQSSLLQMRTLSDFCSRNFSKLFRIWWNEASFSNAHVPFVQHFAVEKLAWGSGGLFTSAAILTLSWC